MKPIRIGLIGFGTVGSGVAKILLSARDRLARRAGRPLELVRVVDKDPHRPRNVELPSGLLTDHLSAVLDDPTIEIGIELIGGLEPARTIILDLLRAGKHVVTANKALLAECGSELFAEAKRAGRCIAFEASVAGGIPIIGAISQSLTANEIRSIRGILNGTSNFILTQMEQAGLSYADALAEAQRLGYAEADPTLDVDGSDAAQKLAILTQLAYGIRVGWRSIPRTGIDRVDLVDLRYAAELGYTIKLLAVAERHPAGLEVHVCPTLVRHGRPLAEVRGAYNAVEVVGDAVGRVFFHGLGAGQMPTASAVVADLIDIAVGRAPLTFEHLALWADGGQDLQTLHPLKSESRYYLRLHVVDRPGVLAEIAGILGSLKISIASVIQHEAEESAEDGVVPLVIMTHGAVEGALQEAIRQIERLPVVRPGVVRLRVQD